jgi:hypothetical protein
MGNPFHIAFYPDRVHGAAKGTGDNLNWTDRSMRSPDVYHD